MGLVEVFHEGVEDVVYIDDIYVGGGGGIGMDEEDLELDQIGICHGRWVGIYLIDIVCVVSDHLFLSV